MRMSSADLYLYLPKLLKLLFGALSSFWMLTKFFIMSVLSESLTAYSQGMYSLFVDLSEDVLCLFSRVSQLVNEHFQ